MEKLQWFKFTSSDWMMGKIQRCPEITQNRFIRLCCLYWNKECEISIEDAIIEIDKEHFDILVSKKIISVSETNINISFLDEQNLEIQETSKDKSKSGIVGNLKRWHPLIYAQFNTKKISLEKAIELSKIIAPQSHTDSNPIATQSQNIADKTIVDKEQTKEEQIIQDEEVFLQKTKKFVFKSALVEYGFEESIVDDWLAVRKTKKATNTKTAFDDFIFEIEKKQCNINEILKICVVKSWSGFKHVWIDNLEKTENGNSKNTGTGTNQIEYQQSAIDAVAKLYGK